jgi:hypothetical protein
VMASDGIHDSEVTLLSYRMASMLPCGRAQYQGGARAIRWRASTT